MLPKLSIVVTADTKEAEAGLKNVTSSVGGVETASKKALASVKSFAVGLASVAAVAAVFKRAVSEAKMFETTMLRIGAVIKATGGAAGRTANDLRSFARNLALNTLESTEGILEAQQRLLTFRKVSGDVFDRTIKVAADLSAVLGQNMSSSAVQLGRALEDPVTGLTALTRSGTVFTDQQKEMVKELVESGKLLEAQSFILDELEAQYGGAAVAAAQGYAGALDTLGQRMQELFLSINDALGITELFTFGANALANVVHGATAMVDYMGERFGALARVISALGSGALETLSGILERLGVTGDRIAGVFNTLGDAITNNGIFKIASVFWDSIMALDQLIQRTGSLGEAFRMIADVGVEVFGRVKDAFGLVPIAVKTGAAAMREWFLSALRDMLQGFQDLTWSVAEGLNNLFGTNLQGARIGAISDGPMGGAPMDVAINEAMYDKLAGEAETKELAESLTAPLESVQAIKDLLQSIKDEELTMPDLLGVGGDGEGTMSGKGKGGGKSVKEQLEEQVAALKDLKQAGRDTWGALGEFVQQFAGKSKAAAIAAIAIQKGLSIAQIIANTAAAQMRALAELGPIAGPPAAAKIGLYGKVQAGLVAATGLMQAAGAGGGGSSGGGGGGGASTAAAAAPAPANYYIDLQGDTFSRASVQSTLSAALQGEIDRGARVVFGGA